MSSDWQISCVFVKLMTLSIYARYDNLWRNRKQGKTEKGVEGLVKWRKQVKERGGRERIGKETGQGNGLHTCIHAYMYTQGALASKHIVCTPLSFANRRFILFTTSYSSVTIVSLFSSLKELKEKLKTLSSFYWNLYHNTNGNYKLRKLVWCGFTCLNIRNSSYSC